MHFFGFISRLSQFSLFFIPQFLYSLLVLRVGDIFRHFEEKKRKSFPHNDDMQQGSHSSSGSGGGDNNIAGICRSTPSNSRPTVIELHTDMLLMSFNQSRRVDMLA